MTDRDMTPMDDVRVGQTWAYHDPTDSDERPMYVKVIADTGDNDGSWEVIASFSFLELPTEMIFVEADRKDWELLTDASR